MRGNLFLHRLSQSSARMRRVVDVAGRKIGARTSQPFTTRRVLNALAAVEFYQRPRLGSDLFRPHFIDPAKPVSVWQMEAIERFYDVIFLDVDGVVRNQAGPIDGAVETINRWQRDRKTVVVVSNTCSNLPESLADTFAGWGFNIDVSQIVTSGMCLERSGLSGKKVFVVGKDVARVYVERAGGEVVDCPVWEVARVADTAVIGNYQPGVTSQDEIFSLMQMARAGKKVILTNPDSVCPVSEDEVRETAGTLGHMVETATGEPIRVKLGKPHRSIYDIALERAAQARGKTVQQISLDKVLAIGDRWKSDILGARDFGVDSMLVLSGVCQLPSYRSRLHLDLVENDVFPTWVLPGIG